MKPLILTVSLLIATLTLPAQTLQLSELMELANTPPGGITHYLANKGWLAISDDTITKVDNVTLLEHNMKWVYKDKGDTTTRLKFFYKKKENRTTKEYGYFENIQYTMACNECFKELKDSIAATGWAKSQDDRTDKQVQQTYNAGNFSLIIFTHYMKQVVTYYDIVVIRKKPVE